MMTTVFFVYVGLSYILGCAFGMSCYFDWEERLKEYREESNLLPESLLPWLVATAIVASPVMLAALCASELHEWATNHKGKAERP